MPPARTLLRASTASSTDFGRHGKALLKLSNGHRNINSQGNNKKANQVNFRDEYMDLDEFFTKSAPEAKDTISSRSDEDNDYPKPNVDLLASLATLGKMIQDQKELIQRQQQQQAITEPANKFQDDELSQVDSGISSGVEKSSHSLESMDCPEVRPNNVEKHSFHDNNVNTYELQPKNDLKSSRKKSKDEQFKLIEERLETPQTNKRGLIPDEIKDIDYWDRRKRNNMAAKKSREERRRKELEILEAAKELEKENAQLATMLKRLTARNELLEARLQTIRKNHLNSSDETFDTTSAENSL